MTEIFVRWLLLFCLIEGCVAMNSMYVKQGSNVVLKCPYTPVIFWSDPATKEMFAIGLVTNKNMDMSPRLTITEDFYLIIHNFTSTDVRTYRCTSQQGKQQPKTFSFEPLLYLNKEEGPVRAYFGLKFKIHLHNEAFKIFFNTQVSTSFDLNERPSGMKINGKKEIKFLDVDEGTKFTLNCSVDSGKPSGTLEWIRNDQHLLFGVHHVSFTFIPKESDNSDNYTCAAQNPATDYPLTKTVQLIVNLRPRVILTAYPSTNVHEGQLLTLTCNYTNNIQYGKIQWLKKIETSSNTSEHIESGNRSISFDKVGRNDMGQYICQVTNRIGTDSSKINITVSFPPTTFKQKVIYNIHGENGKLSTIIIDINCYPSLTVSWAQTAGGKLGIWTTKPNGKAITLFNHNFRLESTIYPTKEEHFGSYHVIVRNSRGSLQLIIQLVLKDESKVNVFQHAAICSTPDAIELKCNISYTENVNWNVMWEHYFDGVLIQTLQGIKDDQSTSLGIHFCDFKDNGQYICIGNANNSTLTGSTLLTVYDIPVLTNREIAEMDSCAILSVYFYDNTNSSLISWFVNDKIIAGNGTSYQLTMKRSDVTLTVYDKQVRTNGFCAELVFPKKLLTHTKLIDCEIRNNIGSIVVLFRKSELENFLKSTFAVTRSSQRNNSITLEYKYNTVNTQIITIRPDTPKMVLLTTGNIYVVVFGLVILFVCTVIFTVCRYKLTKNLCVRHVYQLRSAEATQNNQEQDVQQRGAIYEDIENSQYLTVEWLNNGMSNVESESEGQSDVISFSNVELINVNSYEEINSAFYEDVDWRRSSRDSSVESCPEQDFVEVDMQSTEVCDGNIQSSYCYPIVLCNKREVNHDETQSEDKHNQYKESLELAEQSHIYVTVLSND